MVVKHFEGVRVELRRVSSAFSKVIFQIKKGSKLSPFLIEVSYCEKNLEFHKEEGKWDKNKVGELCWRWKERTKSQLPTVP